MVQVDGADVSGAWSDAEGGTGPAAPSRVDGRASRWNDHRATRRNELVRAAVKSVRRRGADVSMDELASDIGTSKSILYRYFTDKAGLQRAVGQVVLDRMLGELTDASRRVGGPRERIRSMVDVYLGMVDDAPHLYAFVTAPGEAAAGEVRGFVDEIDVLVARTLVPTVLGLDSDASPDDLSGDEAVRATLWAAGVVGTVRAVAERWLDARHRRGPGRCHRAHRRAAQRHREPRRRDLARGGRPPPRLLAVGRRRRRRPSRPIRFLVGRPGRHPDPHVRPAARPRR
jgi:AcrR family transcriptional regulator